jgi:hypothetical protein
MGKQDASVWRREEVVRLYLDTVRGAIPLAEKQLEVMLQILRTRERPITSFLGACPGNALFP